MAHFARIQNGTVAQVISVSNDDCGGGNFPQSEPIGQAFIASLGLVGEWRQTSYNTYRDYRNIYDENGELVSSEYLGSNHRTGGTPFRGQYAAIGDIYNAELDQFVTPTKEQNNE